jgi:glycosyltransferase involved in cell wall biosynthesis
LYEGKIAAEKVFLSRASLFKLMDYYSVFHFRRMLYTQLLSGDISMVISQRGYSPTKALVLLTFNEIHGSRALAAKIPYALFDNVLLVDGGSTDGTREFWESRGVRIATRRSPGRGSAFIIAFEECREDILLFFSPDGNEDPNDISRLLDTVLTSDIVIATRFGKGGTSDDAEVLRTIGNLLFTAICRLLFRANVTDAVNGFRTIWRKSMRALNLPPSRFEIEMQMTIRASKLKMKIAEIPTHEFKRIGGISKAKSFDVGLSYFRLFLKELLLGRRFINKAYP